MLVADEQELSRAGLAAVLKHEIGFSHVIEAGTLDEALVHLRRPGSITLASFDLALPGLTSLTQLQGVREAFPGLRMVVVSASSRRDDILQALASGIHGFIPKTLSIAEIALSFRLVLDGRICVPSCLADVLPDLLAPAAGLGMTHVSVSKAGGLTVRQQDVLDLLRKGKSNKQIARSLNLAVGTVKVHVNAVFRTLDVHSRLDAVTVSRPRSLDGQR